MARVTVRWHKAAENELAAIWLNSADPELIERAANEIDVLLSVDPSLKGRPINELDENSIREIAARALPTPQEFRWLRCGPLEIVFHCSEPDCMAIVLHVARRGRSDGGN